MEEKGDKILAVVQAGKFQSSVKITIPKKIAEELNITHGSLVGFWVNGNEICIRKVR